MLTVPLDVGGRPVRYRFPRQRSGRLANALPAIEVSPPPTATARGFRSALMEISGIGPKTDRSARGSYAAFTLSRGHARWAKSSGHPWASRERSSATSLGKPGTSTTATVRSTTVTRSSKSWRARHVTTACLPFSQLLASAEHAPLRLHAVGSPYYTNNILKARCYRWLDGSDGRPKCWCAKSTRTSTTPRMPSCAKRSTVGTRRRSSSG